MTQPTTEELLLAAAISRRARDFLQAKCRGLSDDEAAALRQKEGPAALAEALDEFTRIALRCRQLRSAAPGP